MKSRGKQGKTGKKSQGPAKFAPPYPLVRNSHHPTPLCEIAFVSIFQKACSRSLPKISVRKCTGMWTLCEIRTTLLHLCEIRTTISTCAKFAPPHPHFGNFWTHFDQFPKFISCILYLVSNLGKSKVHSFKRYTIWSWNEEVVAVWRRLCKVERKCCSRTPFCYFWEGDYYPKSAILHL